MIEGPLAYQGRFESAENTRWAPQNLGKKWGGNESAWSLYVKSGHNVEWEFYVNNGYTGRVKIDGQIYTKDFATNTILKAFLEKSNLLSTYHYLFFSH